ncbi:MAG: hypothetical protein FWH54_00375, partial [Methanobrevibacter sp.]|nr:hypothetical protein [Methanobrevibacter sp.]
MANDIINENMSLIKKSKKIVYMQWLIILGIFTERWYELAILLLVNILIAFFNVKRLSISKNILFIAIIISIYSIIIIKY